MGWPPESPEVIERDRPKGLRRRDLVLVEVDRVVVRAVERLAVAVTQIEWVDGVAGQIGAKPDLGDHGAL